jgi:hypothetical protein
MACRASRITSWTECERKRVLANEYVDQASGTDFGVRSKSQNDIPKTNSHLLVRGGYWVRTWLAGGVCCRLSDPVIFRLGPEHSNSLSRAMSRFCETDQWFVWLAWYAASITPPPLLQMCGVDPGEWWYLIRPRRSMVAENL